MTSREFCYWLQGYFEIVDANPAPVINGPGGMTKTQIETVKRHLAMVFHHEIDPSYPDGKKLGELHSPAKYNGEAVRC